VEGALDRYGTRDIDTAVETPPVEHFSLDEKMTLEKKMQVTFTIA
jgi:hypothetical protein